jgi:hypothetical protein
LAPEIPQRVSAMKQISKNLESGGVLEFSKIVTGSGYTCMLQA